MHHVFGREMEISNLSLGVLAGVIRCLSYDAMGPEGNVVLVSALMELEGVDSDECLPVLRNILDGRRFDKYYRGVVKSSRTGIGCGEKRPDLNPRLVGVLVCLDLARDLQLLTNLDKYNFIFGDFLLHHHREFDSEIFDKLRSSAMYKPYKGRLTPLVVKHAVSLRGLF